MSLPEIPLAAHRAFSASTVDALRFALKTQLDAVSVTTSAETPITALANRYKLPSSELWFCSYGQPVAIHFKATDYFRFQFHHAGAGTTQIGKRMIPVESGLGCVSSSDVTLFVGPGFQQLEWRIDRACLGRKLASITGRPLYRALEFEPALDLRLPRARPLLSILYSLVHCIPDSPGEPSSLVLSELEQALMVSMLIHGEHSGAQMLRANSGTVAPWYVRRVEEYIEANLDKPFDIAQAVSIAGCSARTVYRAFRQFRGYSPLSFSKQRRLWKARRLLRDPTSSYTVTQVAYSCGFGELSHFRREFIAAFGESPSAARRNKSKESRESAGVKAAGSEGRKGATAPGTVGPAAGQPF